MGPALVVGRVRRGHGLDAIDTSREHGTGPGDDVPTDTAPATGDEHRTGPGADDPTDNAPAPTRERRTEPADNHAPAARAARA
jgi:hypothetical protein